jgi:hypothetical protein
MAWTAPMTAIPNTVFTAAQFNTHVRDNLNETAPAKAVTPTGYFVVSGTNQITERVPQFAEILTEETTTSTTYTDLTTFGPSVTTNTGSTAIVVVSGSLMNTNVGAFSLISPEVSGASSIPATNTRSLNFALTTFSQASWVHAFTDLVPGSNTFTLKYSVTAGTGSFRRRRITVLPY